MLTGRPPFSGDNPVSVAYQHVQETPELPTMRNRAIPAALEAVTMKAMAKNPANRYPSAEDLRADLRRFRNDQPVTAETVMVAAPTRATRMSAPPAGATRAVPPVGGTTAYRRVEEAYDVEPPRERRGSAVFVLTV